MVFFLPLIQSSETRNIEYQIKITYTPYCSAETCTNATNSTNYTCYTRCYGTLKVEGINDNNLFFEIDTGSSAWKNGNSESRFGYKTADLGNLSDITGIREDLRNCTSTWNTLFRCYDTVRKLDVNLTSCQTQSDFGKNYTLVDCKIDKTTLENQLSLKSTEINSKLQEIKNTKNDKWTYAVVAAILAGLLVWKGIPYAKGRITPKDESEKQFAANPGY